MLEEFRRDGRIKMEIEDVDTHEMENIWPFILDKIEEQKREEEEERKRLQKLKEQEEEKQQQIQVKSENRLKKAHDSMISKYEAQK
jgi:hypothetical protein